MKLRLLSIVTAFSISMTTAQPYTKDTLKTIENVTGAVKLFTTLGSLVSGQDLKQNEGFHASGLLNELANAALEDDTTMALVERIISSTFADKPNLFGRWNAKKDSKTIALGLVFAIAGEVAHTFEGKALDRLAGTDKLRIVRRAIRVVSNALIEGALASVQDKAKEIVGLYLENEHAEMWNSFTETLVRNVLRGAVSQTVGELLLQGADDAKTESFSINDILGCAKSSKPAVN